MHKLKISKKQLLFFKDVIDKYKPKTKFPKKGYWKTLNDQELWLWLVGQVMVVGSSAGNDRFQKRQDLKDKIDYFALRKVKDDQLKKRVINEVLRAAGVRYASRDITLCWKTLAILHNHNFISNYQGGFKGMITDLASVSGQGSEINRVAFLMKNLKFIKNKSARDFLMSMGINRNTLAIDIRIQNIFKHAGIELPSQAELARNAVYKKTEAQIINEVCTPLDIEPVKFDRILYNNYFNIINKA